MILFQQGQNTPPESGFSSSRKNIFLSIFFIILLGFLVYGNSINNGFLWDDTGLIEKNPDITSFSHIPNVFTGGMTAAEREYHFYRPVQTLSYMIDYSLWKLDARGYHLTNILLHIAAALSLYGLIHLLTRNNVLSLLTAVLFLVHPVHTEAVTYISGRADSLAFLFMILSFLFYMKSASTQTAGISALMVLSYTLALLSRENSLILPALIWAYHYSSKTKVCLKGFLSLVVVLGLYLVLRISVFHIEGTPGANTTTFLQRIPGFFAAFTTYLRILIVPFNLHMEYGKPLFAWTDPKTILGIILFSALCLYAFKRRGEDRGLSFPVLWFLVALLPVSNLYPLNAFMAEHWLYLPSVGFFLLLANGLYIFYKKKKFKPLAIICGTGALMFYGGLTVQQNTYWQDPIRFYERTLKYAPDSSRTYNNLGAAYKAIGQKTKALSAYQKAVELNPNYSDAYYNLGNLYDDQGKTAQAIAAYTKVIALNPDHANAYNNLGNVYFAVHQESEALNAYKKALEIVPHQIEAYNNMGRTYQNLRQNESAANAYKQAIKINPAYAPSYFNLGTLYQETNRPDEAVLSYRKAIDIKNDYIEAYNNLGNVFRSLHKNKEAVNTYKKILEIDPNYSLAYSNLAIVYFEKKEYQKAVEYFEKGKQLGFVNPALQEALQPFR